MVGSAIRSLTAVVQLRDSVSGPLMSINRSMDLAKVKAGGFVKAIQANRMALMGLGAILTGIGAMGGMLIKTGVSFEQSMAYVAKTTGLAGKGLKKLGGSLKNLSTIMPTSAGELASIAQIAGQLGIKGTENIREFTRTVAMMSVAFEMPAEAAAENMAKVSNALGVPITDIEKFGSAINILGNTTAASERDILSTMVRIAPAAAQLGIAAADVNALAASLIDMGQMPERAGTRMKEAFIEMSSNLDKMSKQMGVPFEELKRRMDEGDAMGVLLDYIETIRNTESATDRLAMAEEVLGKTGAQAILSLANNYDNLNENLEKSNKAFEEGLALQEEYERATATFAASLKKLRNVLGIIGIEAFDVLKPLLNLLVDLALKFRALPTPIKTGLAVILALTTAIAAIGGPLLLMAGALAMVVPHLAFLVPAAVSAAFATGGLSAAMWTLAGAVWSALAPLIPIVLAVAAVAVVFQHIWKKNLWGVQEATAKVFGGIKKVVGVTLKALKAVFSGFAAVVVPVFTPLLKLFGLINEGGQKSKALVGVVDAIGGAFRWLYSALKPHFPLLKGILRVIGMVAGALLLLPLAPVIAMLVAFKLAWDKIGGVLDWIGFKLSWLKIPLMLLLAPLALLLAPIAAVVLAFRHWEEIKAIVGGVVDWIGGKISWLVDLITGAMEGIKSLTNIIPDIGIPDVGGITSKLGLPKFPSLEIASPGAMIPPPNELKAPSTAMASAVKTASTHVSNVSKIIGKVEIKVDGVSDPRAVAKMVKKEIIQHAFSGILRIRRLNEEHLIVEIDRKRKKAT